MVNNVIEMMGSAQLQNVGKVFVQNNKPEIILRNCSFSIEPGKLTVLIGPSGCGKSTVINLIAGFAKPTMGNVSIDGKLVQGPDSDRAVVFQETALFPWMTLLDNVTFGPLQRGVSREESRREAKKLLEKIGLRGFEDKYPDQISGGMQRRAEVARVLINKPKLIMLDEPFRGLDHMSRGLMQEYYSSLFEETRITNLFVTSEIDEAIFLADRIVVLSYKPTQVKAIVEVPLPRPRKFQMSTSKIYADIKEYILDLLYEEALKGFASLQRKSEFTNSNSSANGAEVAENER